MAAGVALSLAAPLDVVIVRKLGVPAQPELAMGAIGEGGIRVLDHEIVGAAGVAEDEIARVEHREREELRRRAETYRAHHPQVPLLRRTVVVVDDGIATGATALAACQVVRGQGAARVVLATPVAPAGWTERFADAADELVAVLQPGTFYAIGQFYEHFDQTTDDEVVEVLGRLRTRDRGTGTSPS